ncbi:MAG: ATP-binding protein [Microbacterium sp.]|uniref:ATP-binding protein n=1 Tax=Microbacterium sp. TaxID=51671 RepID=UPI001AD0594C|nr:ATP-binding protein [Microbacterium sp.]MBN9176727.1 ATP-binding protein [Microbacterium sp.]
MTREPTLRSVADAADAARFVGREEQLRVFRQLLDAEATSRVLFVHGPGGSGKSALVREMTRRARVHGFATAHIDGRRPVDVAFAAVAAASGREATGVAFVDEADALGGALPAVRDRLLDSLGGGWRIVVAGRHRPDPTWREHGLDAIFVDLALPPLSTSESARLLGLRGVADEHSADIIRWAKGSPLALTVASVDPAAADATGGTGSVPSAGELEQRLVAWLTGRSTLDAAADLIDVAAIAPSVDARLLAAALPGRATREGMPALLALPVVESMGQRAVLHDVLAAAVRERMRRSEPDRLRELTVRIVRHLGTRARLGEVAALMDLSQFVEHPVLRDAISNRPGPNHYVDLPADGEFDRFTARHGFDENLDVHEVRRWSAQPGRLWIVVRRSDGEPVLFAAFVPATQLRDEGPVTASLLDVALREGIDLATSYAGIGMLADAPQDDLLEASRLGAAALVARHGRPDMTAVVAHFPAPDRRPLPSVEPITRMMASARGRPVVLTDFRPWDVARFVEAQVLSELGVAAPAADALELLGRHDLASEREALLSAVFGDNPRDRRLRTVLDLAYAASPVTEAEALDELHVSRLTWFRLLREARERVAARTAAAPAPAPAGTKLAPPRH